MRFAIHLFVTALALGVAANVVPGVKIQSGGALILAALILGLVNATVRPVLMVLTLPLTVFTMGLFLFVVNGIAFAVAAAIAPGFRVTSFGSAIGGAAIVFLVSWIAAWLLRQAATPPRTPPA